MSEIEDGHATAAALGDWLAKHYPTNEPDIAVAALDTLKRLREKLEAAEENAGWAEIALDSRPVPQPTREALIESLKVAMLGTTDGGFIEPESDIPAGEMFRLAAEWVERNAAALSPTVEGEVEWAETLENDGTHEFTTSSDCDGSDARRWMRTPRRVIEAGQWVEVL